MATKDEPRQQPLHILFFPFLATGHLIPVANMAALFAARGARCTILTTPVNASIIRPAVDRANDANFHGPDSQEIVISVVPFPRVGLPPGFENVQSPTPANAESCHVKFLRGAHLLREPFEQFLAAKGPHSVDAVVSDSFFPWSADAAAAHGVTRLVFLGTSVFARSCSESMLRNNPLENMTTYRPDGEDPDDDARLVSLPGLPDRVELRRSQMLDPTKRPEEWAMYQSTNAADQRSFGEVFNSFRGLEPDYLEYFHATLGRRAWLVGPVALTSSSSSRDTTEDVANNSCLRWLDTKPAGSVVYVSLGTNSSFSAAEEREIARGLDLSGNNFLWVIRGTIDESSEWMPPGFAELLARGGRGFVARGWAPQTLILDHLALGGFVTHCGWNSVLEAVSAGVPMVMWPRYCDQFHNEKLLLEVLKVGVSIGAKDYATPMEAHEVISGEVVGASIRRLMSDSEEGDAIRKKAKELSVMARSAAEKGGSSYNDVGRLLDELIARRSPIEDFAAATG
ncbi:unnamed protein product [Alopecurus aequalis]